MNKGQLIYEAASEAVMELRLHVRMAYPDGHPARDLDADMARAQNKAGEYALKAFKADARKVSSVRQLLRRPA